MEFEELIHPVVARAALSQYQTGHYRDAVLNAILSVFDLIRSRTGLDLDGADLIGKAFSEHRPYLRLGNLATTSGRNTQVGFMQMAKGLFQGVRGPKAHSSMIETTQHQAARYLAMASALADQIDRAEQGNVVRSDGVYVFQSERDTNCLKFFESMKVLSVSVARPDNPYWVPDWLTLDWAKWNDHVPGTASVVDDNIEFSIPVAGGGEVQYRGQVCGPVLRLRVFSTATGSGSRREYYFRPTNR